MRWSPPHGIICLGYVDVNSSAAEVTSRLGRCRPKAGDSEKMFLTAGVCADRTKLPRFRYKPYTVNHRYTCRSRGTSGTSWFVTVMVHLMSMEGFSCLCFSRLCACHSMVLQKEFRVVLSLLCQATCRAR